MIGRIEAGLRPFFGTANDIVLLTASGTGGLEAAVVNVLSPGDRVLAATVGAFGDRFARIATVYGAEVTRLEAEWGRAIEPDALRDALSDGPSTGYRAILLTHNETATGVTNPVAELAAVARAEAPEALLLVDGISALGAVPFEQDAWGIDVLVSGSQKAWMAAPGMSFVSVSERGWEATETARMPRFYLDLRAHRTSQAGGETPWTPAVAVMFQLDVALGLLAAEGVGAVFARHAGCAAAVRAGVAAAGFELLADPRYASTTVTAAWLPDDIEWKPFNADLRARGLVIAGGQGKLKGRVFRFGHLGDITMDSVLAAIGVLEEVAILHGRPVVPGSAVAAAQRAAAERAALEGEPAERAATSA
jgi:aspartate aminotransferase-like enzyme